MPAQRVAVAFGFMLFVGGGWITIVFSDAYQVKLSGTGFNRTAAFETDLGPQDLAETGDESINYESDPAVPGQYIVVLRSEENYLKEVSGLAAALSGKAVIKRLPLVGSGRLGLAEQSGKSIFSRLALVEVLGEGIADLEVLAMLKRHPAVLNVEPNWILRVHSSGLRPRFPNDFEFGQLWNMWNTGQRGGLERADIAAPEAWSLTTGSRDVVVAVIDTGIDFFHPDLEPNIWVNRGEVPGNGIDDDGNGYIDDVHGFDFVWKDSDAMDDMIHGTHVAGIIGAVGNNLIGVTGVAWSVSLMALKAFDEKGEGQLWDVIEALHYAAANGARIINASWGQKEYSTALHDVIAEVREKGIVVIASAGNKQSDRVSYPAAFPGVIAVAAVNNRDERPFYSNYGPRTDVAAPGENVRSTVVNNLYDNLSGTSMSAPHVSGVAALVWSIRPHFTAREVEDVLRNSVDPTHATEYVGLGRINAGRAVRVIEPLPKAALDLPPQLMGVIDFRGTASGASFAGYKIEWGRGTYPSNWTLIAAGSVPVENGVLSAGFRTDALEDGSYVIRLTVWDDKGQTAVARGETTIRNIVLKSPMDNDVLRAGEIVPIRGTVFGAGRTYKLEYGLGPRPAQWSTDGLEMTNGGRENVADGILGWWDTRAVPPNEYYTLRLAVTAGDRLVGESKAQLIFLDAQIRPGWPQYVDAPGDYPTNDWREVTVADIDNDGLKEILRVTPGRTESDRASLLVYGADGSLRWKKELVAGDPGYDVPVAGDVDGDGFLEVFVDVGGYLFGFHHDGTPLEGSWPVPLEVPALGKVLADLDADGRLELVGYAQMPLQTSAAQVRQLVVYNSMGQLLYKFNLRDFSPGVDVPRMFPAVGNLDEDPSLEIVAVDGGFELVMFDITKQTTPVWRVRVNGCVVSSPAIGDLDGDGKPEIVVGVYDVVAKGQPGTAGGVYAFDRNGCLLPGWPVLIEDSFKLSPALADLDQDNRLEVIIPSCNSLLHALKASGFDMPGWPVRPYRDHRIASSPVVGDVDGDGRPDVVAAAFGVSALAARSGDITRLGGVAAWRADGTSIDLNPHPQLSTLMFEHVFTKSSPPTLVDLDGDGFLDLVAATVDDRAFPEPPLKSYRKGRYTVTAWALANVHTEPNKLPWPMLRRDPQHTGYSAPQKLVNKPPKIDRIPDQTVRVGTPFFPIELDHYVFDPDNNVAELQWTVEGQTNLRVTVSPNRVVTIDAPAPDWVGRELIRFVVRDPFGLTAETSAVFEARLDYEPPVPEPDFAVCLEDEMVEINPLTNDAHPHQLPLAVIDFSRPNHGTVERLSPILLRYTPEPNYAGTDSFSYVVGDGQGGIGMSRVEIKVLPVPDPPVAEADRVITNEDEPVDFDPTENDYDPDGDLLRISAFTQAEHGRVVLVNGSTLRYEPLPDFNGTDKFTYRIVDPEGHEAEADVIVLVKPVNDPPVAKSMSFTINRNTEQTVIFQATDKDNDTLAFRVVEGPQNGELWTYPAIATYYPRKGFAGVDSFTYIASDGTAESEPALVSITVLDANNLPVVQETSITTRVGRPVQIQLTAKDYDDDPIEFELISFPEHGTLSGSGSNYVYSPHPDYLGDDKFTVRAWDGKDPGPVATITLRVTDQNSAPIAKDSKVEVFVNTPTDVKLDATDGENDALNFILLSLPMHGKLTGVPPHLMYHPEKDFIGPDRFKFKVNDGELESDAATVSIAVIPPNHIPIAKDQTVAVAAGVKSEIPLLVEDVDQDNLRLVILKGPRNGLVSGLGTNYVYTPRPGFLGLDWFTYRAWDGMSYSDVATVTLSVQNNPQHTQPRFESIRLLEGSALQLIIRVRPGARLGLLASTNLVEWTLVTNLIAPDELVTLIDGFGDFSNSRFYRARAE